MMSTTFAEIVDQAHKLDKESKQELLDLLHAWLVEERREEIRRNADEADIELAQGQVRRGTVQDLIDEVSA